MDPFIQRFHAFMDIVLLRFLSHIDSILILPVLLAFIMKYFMKEGWHIPGGSTLRNLCVGITVSTALLAPLLLVKNCSNSCGTQDSTNCQENDCEATMGSVLMFIIMYTITWLGWKWDFGLVQFLFRLERRRIRDQQRRENVLGVPEPIPGDIEGEVHEVDMQLDREHERARKL